MSPLVTLLTDFGPGSIYVGQMHAVLRTRCPGVTILDLAHDVPPGALGAARYLLRRSYALCPPWSVHVVVVDPGVGTSRAILAAEAHGHRFVGADNGVLADLVATGEVRRVEARALLPAEVAPTFHGRDVMAPVAAHLAGGGRLDDVGPRAEPVPLRGGPTLDATGLSGCVLLEDRFGNLITDIPRRLVELVASRDGPVRVRIGAAFIDGLSRTFADVPTGRALAYVGSGDHLEIAVNGGRASDLLRLGVGSPVRVERSPT